MLRELAAIAKENAGAESPAYAGRLAALGSNLLQQSRYQDAEAVLRESLAIREMREPDAWTTFNTESMLGDALRGQEEHAEAQPLLLQGYEGMKQRAAKIPAQHKIRLIEALERLVQLYDAWDKPDEAAKWRSELEAVRAAAKKPAG